VDVNVVDASNGNTPLHYAQTEISSKLILEAGGDVKALNIENKTPPDLAKEMGRADVVRALTSGDGD
jgi:ankyrin repeat protein